MLLATFLLLTAQAGQEAREAGEARAADASALTAFRFDAEKLAVGRVYQYVHSNVDGSRPSRVTLHLAAADRLEALKWSPDAPDATLVVAHMDWRTFSVKGFETFSIGAGGERAARARLETTEAGELVAHAGGRELRCNVERWPWHSYDFDLASLNVSMRFLVDPEQSLTVAVADFVRDPDGGRLAFKGDVHLEYLGDEERGGLDCRKYSIDGPGLEHRGGHLWTTRDDERCVVDFEIDLPDEPGFTSGKLLLQERTEMSAEEWNAFVAERVP